MILDAFERHQIKRQLRKVNKWAPKMRKMSDEELKSQTKILQKQLADGKTVDQILPRAFAAMREADLRVLKMFPYDAQVMGAIVLNQGYIAEMKTGEGKTLTATLALYLNALSGKGAILVTPNAYLAQRDEEQLAPVYEWMGLTVSTGFPKDDPERKVQPEEKRKWYNSDILYTTASNLAFDYLFNNLAANKDGQYLRPYHYVIIDEVDDVLLDQATSPFVVASAPMLQSNLYRLCDDFVRTLVPKRDFTVRRRDKAIWLTYNGVQRAEQYFRIRNLYDDESREVYRHIALAMRAHYFMKNGHDYLVEKGKVVLLDETDGRLKNGVKVNTGLHQAVEQKEHVKVTDNQKTAASITFPSLFGLFDKISGMSGTVKGDEDEFINVYNMKVVQIPTHKPVIRKDYPAKIYLTTSEKLMQALNDAITLHKAGRPILLVAGSVENSEIISELLLDRGIPHNVLNAFNIAREAAIVKDAGQPGAVTVATNMAGRGTDIKLGPGVKEKGGLAVIGTEMLPERVKLQLAGRAGRQGDPGSSQFYISLEDSYIAKASTKRFKKMYRKLVEKRRKGAMPKELTSPRIRLSLEMLKSRVADGEVRSRKKTNKYEVALRIQRTQFYKDRAKLMNNARLERTVGNWLSEGIDDFLNTQTDWSPSQLQHLINEHSTYKEVKIPDNLMYNRKAPKKYLENLCTDILKDKYKTLINTEQLNQFYRSALLTALDSCWTDQVNYLNDLRIIVEPWSLSGRDPGYIYQVKAFESYKNMLREARKKAVDNLLLSRIKLNKKNQLVVSFN